MDNPATNLKRIMEQLGISNIVLSKAISVDPSLISRWLNGRRQIKLSSDILITLTDYLLNKIQSMNYTDWLKRQMENDGLALDYSSSSELQKGLKIWLANDGYYVNGTLDLIHASASNGKAPITESENCVLIGFIEISAFFMKTLNRLPNGAKIDIHISNEDVGLLLHESISKTFFDAMLEKKFQVRLVISLSSNTTAMSRLLSHYIQSIVEGLLSISVVHSMTQTITNQSTFIIGDALVFIVCETPKSAAPPIGMSVYEMSFLREAKKSFERVNNFSQALYQRYNDDYSRNIIEILHQEYATPGNLDVIKDNVNPLCMSQVDYDRFLRTFGDTEEQFAWRSAEFARFKAGMEEIMQNDSVFREMLSLNRLRQIAVEGKCKMPALYFMYTGITYLDAPGCLSVIEGYIDFLKRIQNFHLIILDEMPILNENCCWHLKQNLNITLNGWTKDEHIIISSNQLMLTHEFQMIYNDLWNKENYSEGKRKKAIQTLQDITEQLKRNHNLK